MIYAKIHTYTDLSGKEAATVTSSESIAEGTEGEWVAFDVPYGTHFVIDNGAICVSQIDHEMEASKSRKRQEIQGKLVALDQQRIRPLAEGDIEYLLKLNAIAVSLRSELAGI